MNTQEATPARKLLGMVDSVNTWVARACSYIVLIMAFTISYEVVCRYFLAAPTDWAGELNQYLLCAMSMLGGAYCLIQDQHVRVDFIYRRCSLRQRAILEFCTWWMAALFCVILVWWGGELALDALLKDKRSSGLMEMPLFPSQVMIPLGALLLLVQIIARMFRNALVLKSSETDDEKLREQLGISKGFGE